MPPITSPRHVQARAGDQRKGCRFPAGFRGGELGGLAREGLGCTIRASMFGRATGAEVRFLPGPPPAAFFNRHAMRTLGVQELTRWGAAATSSSAVFWFLPYPYLRRRHAWPPRAPNAFLWLWEIGLVVRPCLKQLRLAPQLSPRVAPWGYAHPVTDRRSACRQSPATSRPHRPHQIHPRRLPHPQRLRLRQPRQPLHPAATVAPVTSSTATTPCTLGAVAHGATTIPAT